MSVSTSATNTTKPAKVSQPVQRYARYRPIVDFVVQQSSFAIDAVKRACADETPHFVTRVVHELEEDGWIVRESVSGPMRTAPETYRWNQGKGEFRAGRWLDRKIFGSQITATPEQERPRERLLAEGVEDLRNSELLAILIRSGQPGESAIMAGQRLAQEFDRRLQDLPAAARAELKSISVAIDKTAYCQIMAGVELGRRVASVTRDRKQTKITSAADAIAYCRAHFARLAEDSSQEEFHIVTLDTKNKVVTSHRITIGTLDASLVHPREVFRPAIKDAAASIILAHNHPSGDATPSAEDFAVTRRLESAGELLGIDVLDHIVVGRDSAVSIRECRR